jgi:hypothetical protein
LTERNESPRPLPKLIFFLIFLGNQFDGSSFNYIHKKKFIYGKIKYKAGITERTNQKAGSSKRFCEQFPMMAGAVE